MRSLGAVLLTGTMETTTVSPRPITERVPVIRRIVLSIRVPLDLENDVFRYLARNDGSLRPAGVPPAPCGRPAHTCRRPRRPPAGSI